MSILNKYQRSYFVNTNAKYLSLLILMSFVFVFLVGCASSKPDLLKTDQQEEKRDLPLPDEAVQVNPKVVDHVILGSLYESQGDFIRAIHEYNQALLYDSCNAAIFESLADNYLEVGEWESAGRVVQKALKQAGETRELLTLLGEIQFQLDQLEDARITFQSLVEQYPDDLNGWNNLAALYVRLGNHLKAVECYDEVLRLNGPRMEILVRQATILGLAKEYELAISVYNKMAEIEPGDDLIPFTIGGLYLEVGDTTRADSIFEIASSLAPFKRQYWEIRIRLAIIMDDTTKALSLGEKALVNIPNDVDMLGFVASAYTLYKIYDQSETLLLKAVELDTAGVGHLISLGFLYHELKRWNDAEEIYRTGLEIEPGNALLNNNYAYFLAESGRQSREANQRFEEAMIYVNVALELEPDNPSFLDTKGWLLYLVGEFEQAITFLEQAAIATPGNPEVLDHLGEAYFAIGDREQANMMWTRALDNGANESEIRQKLER